MHLYSEALSEVIKCFEKDSLATWEIMLWYLQRLSRMHP